MVNSVAFKWWLTHCTSICSGVQESKLTDLTRDMCTPRLRWIPAQRMHMNTPRFQDAQRGPRMVVTQTEPNTVSLTGPVPFQLTLSPTPQCITQQHDSVRVASRHISIIITLRTLRHTVGTVSVVLVSQQIHQDRLVLFMKLRRLILPPRCHRSSQLLQCHALWFVWQDTGTNGFTEVMS